MTESILERSFAEAAECLNTFRADPAAQQALARLVSQIAVCFEAGGKILIAGNGGSMTDAMHFAEEWTGRFRFDRRPFPALALADPAHMSCVANDFGFDHVFSRMVEAFARPEDILILLTTSGNSPNLLLAAETAHRIGTTVIGFLGRDGGRLKPLCDTVILTPGATSDRIQELHMLSLHIVIEAAEVKLGVA
jgi:D-sedoheptulose 7-phosphate isomerase